MTSSTTAGKINMLTWVVGILIGLMAAINGYFITAHMALVERVTRIEAQQALLHKFGAVSSADSQGVGK